LHDAIADIDSLIASMPNNPYFYELKGQACLKADIRRRQSRRCGAPSACARPCPYPDHAGAGADCHERRQAVRRSHPLLHAALIKEPESADAYLQLAMAYARKNDLADADLASAQAAFARGDNKTARELASRAKEGFPIGSPGWVRADDIVAFNKNVKQNP
jgi:predicted Zn-dependent protease